MIRIRRVAKPGELSEEHAAIVRKLDKRMTGGVIKVSDLPHYYWWLAFDTYNEVAGFAGMQSKPRYKYAFLGPCGVLPAYRGMGIQGRFINVREAQARREGLKCCVSYTMTWNTHSANNLIRAGYTLYKPSNPCAGTRDVIYFQKELT